MFKIHIFIISRVSQRNTILSFFISDLWIRREEIYRKKMCTTAIYDTRVEMYERKRIEFESSSKP